ncbi:MAG: FISUMP domain-containing protein [Bacteroidota bacterium]
MQWIKWFKYLIVFTLLSFLFLSCKKEPPVGEILVTVQDDLDGRLLDGAKVEINDTEEDFSEVEYTDAEGKASFLEVDLSKYEITVSSVGYESKVITRRLEEGGQLIDELIRLEREKDPPVLSLSTDKLVFEADESMKMFEVINDGQKLLKWRVDTDDPEDLIESIVPNEGNTLGGETRGVTVNLNREGVRGGRYFATLIVDSDGTGTGMKTVDLEINVQAAETPPTIQTLSYTNVGIDAAEIFANLSDWGVNGQESEVGFVWSSQVEEPALQEATSSSLKMADLSLGSNPTYNGFITGLTPETKYYVRAYARNVAGIAYGNTLTLITDLLDSRDNQVYDLLEIGGNIWMQKNLNFATTGSECFNGLSDNCSAYGQLYVWAEAQNSCPSGWQVPTDQDWYDLENAVDPSIAAIPSESDLGFRGNNAGNALKSGGVAEMDLLLGGQKTFQGDFESLGLEGVFWSQTPISSFPNGRFARSLKQSESGVGRFERSDLAKYSMRCVKE